MKNVDYRPKIVLFLITAAIPASIGPSVLLRESAFAAPIFMNCVLELEAQDSSHLPPNPELRTPDSGLQTQRKPAPKTAPQKPPAKKPAPKVEPPVAPPPPAVNPALFSGLRYRLAGPSRGGRVTAVAGHRKQPSTYYMGSTGGGVWKTTDYGQSWWNISDGFFATGSIGAIDVAESDPNIIYVGTGSAAIRSNVIVGKGVYKSTDAGKSWTHVGLREVGQIGALRVNPQNPDVAYVAALGSPFGPNPERGVFRTRDGGKSWEKVLFINNTTGAVSLAINPADPKELYAGIWRAERKPWTIISGGPALRCGLYKSTNSGTAWTKLNNGLPRNLIGKIDVDVSRANPRRVYVILEAPGAEAGVYRSDNAGGAFTQVNSDPRLIARPFYYTYIDADPKNADTLWVNNLSLWKSTDGGKNFADVATPHGDNHGMWINPDNPDLIVQSNDGGANVSQDGGRSWSTQYNQPTAEIYQVEVDQQFPYRLYGAQQDNTTLIVPSLPPLSARVDDPLQLWMPGPGCETGPIRPKPDNPNIVYGVCKGEFSRINLATGQEQNYWVHPQNRYGHAAKDIKYRFQRVSPLEISPGNPRIIYHASHVVHRSTDEGITWEVISPDLTAREPDKQGVSGEPITRDITGEEVYSTIYALRESVLDAGVIWSGANDGPVYVTRDGGKNWKNVTPKDLPPGGRVQNLEPSPHRHGSAYIAVYRYLLNDWQPYIYNTEDYGASWKRLTDGRNGIPADCPTRVVREDPDREGLLYAGTEFGMYLSFDNGVQWQPFQLNLPVTPVTDIRVFRKDLVLSTMGRSFWILDNISLLHQVDDKVQAAKAFLYQPRDAYRLRYASPGRGSVGPDYPRPGVNIDYYFSEDQPGVVRVEILDPKGRVIRAFSSDSSSGSAAELSNKAGMRRFIWDMRHAGAWDAGPQRAGSNGPLVLPGSYQVRMSSGDWSQARLIEVKIDPRLAADGVTAADLEEQLALNLRIRDAISEARKAAVRVAEARKKLSKRAATDPVVKRLSALDPRLVTAPGPYPQPMLIDQLGNLYRMTGSADQKVGRVAFQYLEELQKELASILNELDRIPEAAAP